MADPRFFHVSGPFTVGRLAEIAGARPGPGSDLDRSIADVAPLETAGPEHVTFFDGNRLYLPAFETTRAGACLVKPERAGKAPAGAAVLVMDDPYRGYARVAQAFHPLVPPEPGVSPAAIVDATAQLAPGCRIEPGAVIGARAEIGRRTLIGANTVIGPGVVIGDDCAHRRRRHRLPQPDRQPRASSIPARDRPGRLRLRAGPGTHLKIPQLGRVVIEDDVEIGANTTIDRGAWATP